MSVGRILAKQRVELAHKPTYGLEWTLAGDVSMERRLKMRAELEDTTGFVK
jgi:hypothetical protein